MEAIAHPMYVAIPPGPDGRKHHASPDQPGQLGHQRRVNGGKPFDFLVFSNLGDRYRSKQRAGGAG